MIKKHLVAPFMNTGTVENPVWTRIKKSTELTIAMNPETEEFDYISDPAPTTELKEYKPSIEQPLKMIEGEPDFQFFWEMFKARKVGNDAKKELMLVYMFDKSNEGTEQAPDYYYAAWKVMTTVTFDEMNCNDSQLQFTLGFGGDVADGYMHMSGTPAVPTWAATLP